MTTRIQRCPVDASPLDTHSERDFEKCEAILRERGTVTLPAPQTKVKGIIHESWKFTLPERYQG